MEGVRERQMLPQILNFNWAILAHEYILQTTTGFLSIEEIALCPIFPVPAERKATPEHDASTVFDSGGVCSEQCAVLVFCIGAFSDQSTFIHMAAGKLQTRLLMVSFYNGFFFF